MIFNKIKVDTVFMFYVYRVDTVFMFCNAVFMFYMFYDLEISLEI